jgi:hypothetical protein
MRKGAAFGAGATAPGDAVVTADAEWVPEPGRPRHPHPYGLAGKSRAGQGNGRASHGTPSYREAGKVYVNPKPPFRRLTRLKSLVAASAISLGLVGAGLVAAVQPASADPSFSYVAVGSDTIQDVMNAFAHAAEGGEFASYNAVNPVTATAHEIITPAVTSSSSAIGQNNCSFTRPNGSTEGFRALDFSLNPSTTLPQDAVPPQPGCIEISRSSSGPGAAAVSGTCPGAPGCTLATGNLVYIPMALDAVTDSNGPSAATVAAYSFTATSASPAVFTASGSAYTTGETVELTGTSLPGGFTAGTIYYIVSPSTDTFELAATEGGAAIASTSTGSGTVQFFTTTLCESTTTGCSSAGTITFSPTATNITDGNLFTQAELETLFGTGMPVTLSDGTEYWPADGAVTQPTGSKVIDLYVPQPGSGTLSFWATQMGFSASSPPAWDHQTILAGPATGVAVEEHDGTAFASDPNGLGPLSIAQWISQSNNHDDRRHGDQVNDINGISPFTGTSLNESFPIVREVYNVMPYDAVVNTGDGNFDPALAALFAGSSSLLCSDVFTIKAYGFATLPSPSTPDDCGATSSTLRVQETNSSSTG